MSDSGVSGTAASVAGAGGPQALRGLLLATGGLFLADVVLVLVVGGVVALTFQFFGLAVLAAVVVLPFTGAFLVAYHVASDDERMGNRLGAA